MIGVVGGDTYGGAPGLEVNLGFKGFNFYTEDEYLFDASHSYNNYFYSWTELTWAPADWVRFGIVAQRTQAYDTEGHVQRGPMLGVSFKHIELTSYVFNPGWSDPVWVFSIGFKF